MPKLIYQGDELAAVILEGEEIGTVVGALRVALEIRELMSDADLGPLATLLGDLTMPPPSDQPKGEPR